MPNTGHHQATGLAACCGAWGRLDIWAEGAPAWAASWQASRGCSVQASTAGTPLTKCGLLLGSSAHAVLDQAPGAEEGAHSTGTHVHCCRACMQARGTVAGAGVGVVALMIQMTSSTSRHSRATPPRSQLLSSTLRRARWAATPRHSTAWHSLHPSSTQLCCRAGSAGPLRSGCYVKCWQSCTCACCLRLSLSAPLLQIYSGSYDGTIRVWDLESGQVRIGLTLVGGHASGWPCTLVSGTPLRPPPPPPPRGPPGGPPPCLTCHQGLPSRAGVKPAMD